jgi:cytochrome c-type protein NapC
MEAAAGVFVTQLIIFQIILSIVLTCIFLFRPSVTTDVTWKIVAFVGLCVLPALCIDAGVSTHMQRSEQTQFCISCHVMAPYGQSLYVDDTKHIPAQHFQNHRVPPDMACYACHADYTIYGPLKDKLQGIKRIYMQYVSTPPDPVNIRISGGFKNSQCLHCHLGARSFEENPVHSAIMDSLKSNQFSCITCHDTVHDVANVGHEKLWSPTNEN